MASTGTSHRLPRWRFPTRDRVRATAVSLGDAQRESFYRSIRFRLTAWYAAVLIVVLITIGFAISTSVNDALQEETDNRLIQAAENLRSQTEPSTRNGAGLTSTEIEGGEVNLDQLVANWPDLSNFLTSGLWIQFVNGDGTKPTIPTTVDNESFGNLADKIAFPYALLSKIDVEAVIDSGEAAVMTVSADGRTARAVILPITFPTLVNGQTTVITIGAVAVGTVLTTQENTLEVVNRTLLIAGFFAVVVGAWAGWILAGRALKPVRKITSTAESIANQPSSAQSLAIRIDVPKTGDEVSHLAATFNSMLSQIEAAFATQRRFVGDASHELRTPLTAIRGNVDVLLHQARSGRTIGNDLLVEALNDVHRESARMARLIDDLLTLARDDARGLAEIAHPTVLALDNLAQDVFETLEPLANGRTLQLHADETVTVLGDRDRLTQIIIILGENAIRHTPVGGTVTITVDRAIEPGSGNRLARISVSDSGEGISAEHLPHIFERFYRASGARERGSGGTGLGLSIALGIVRAHNGWIDVETAPGRGSTFSVHLPLATPGTPIRPATIAAFE